MSLFVTQTHRPDEALVLWIPMVILSVRLSPAACEAAPIRLYPPPCKVLSHERGLCDHTLPRFALGLSCMDHLEELLFTDTTDLRDWN